MNDYGVEWPLWDDEGQCKAHIPPLPPAVRQEILAWTQHFNDSYSREYGWPSSAAAAFHRRQGERLLEIIRRELPSGDTIDLQLWESRSRLGF